MNGDMVVIGGHVFRGEQKGALKVIVTDDGELHTVVA